MIVNLGRHKLHGAWCCEERESCFICEGGLALCTTCGGAEATLPTHCPGVRFTEHVEEQVRCGVLDYTRVRGWYRVSTAKKKGKLV